ncbi:ras GEF [Polyporus arcularius HHB13444]|uniref:Ras GEF n=1 Tax=Polyporus arcularius HHB13444 TaxID=1314778 RepID=A0A5C3PZ21_9APHY|nr:ras GEF [Polyporus arcularius HHB13444]
MAVLHHKPSRRGGLRPRLWIDPNPSNAETSLSTPASSVSPDPNPSLAGSSEDTDNSTPTSSAELFYVLCLYDYDAEDSDQLSFRRNDILDVVKKEDTGWWAAIRPDDNTVGWIPSAFVEPISDALADKLKNGGDRVLIYQDDHKLHGSPELTDPFVVSDGEHRGYDWMPLMNGDKVPILQLGSEPSVPDMTNAFSPLVPPHEGIDANPADAESELSPTEVILSRRKSRPPPLVESPYTEEGQVLTIPPAPVEEQPLPSTPRTPGSARRRSMSLPSGETPPSDHQRSRSESSKPSARRHLRRRPLLIDDQSSLKRLTTLFEAHNLEELDHLIMSPVVQDSFDSFARGTNCAIIPRPDKIKQITGDDEAQAFHDAKLIQATWYLRPLYGEWEMQLLPDGSVSAGTLRALVEWLTVDFLKPIQETRYRQAFLTTYKSFATAEEVFDLLVAQFNISHPGSLSLKELEQWKEKKLKPTRRRVLTVLHVWTDQYGLLQDDPYLARRIVDFVSSITSPPVLASTAKDVLKSLERYISVIPPTPVSAQSRHKRGKGSKSELIRMDTLVLAEHLCVQEQKLYSKIRPHECMNWVKHQTGNAVRNLVVFNALHEKLGAWVKLSILSTEGLGKRAETIDFWIKVAEKCKSMHNYASMHALVYALSSPVISRLHLTWAHVGRRVQLEQLAKYHEPTGNFSAYRLLQRSVDGHCIPYIGMYLMDLQLADQQHPDDILVAPSSSPLGTTVSLIHFAKRENWWQAIDAMLRHQAKPYTLAEDSTIVTYIETNLVQAGEKDQGSFWMKSQEIQQAEMQHADIRKGLELAGF